MEQWLVVAGLAFVGALIVLVDIVSARRNRRRRTTGGTPDRTRVVHRLHPWAGMDEWQGS